MIIRVLIIIFAIVVSACHPLIWPIAMAVSNHGDNEPQEQQEDEKPPCEKQNDCWEQ